MNDNVRCTCKHPFQDSLYGIGNRATTPMKSGQMRCTVCGIVHGSQSVVKTAKAPVITQETAKTEKKPDVKVDKKPGPKVSKKKPDVKDEKKKDDKKKSVKGGKR